MISCAEAMSQLWGRLEGVLAPAELDALEEHLAFCRRCCGELEFVAELQRLLASQPPATVPADVRARLERFIDEL